MAIDCSAFHLDKSTPLPLYYQIQQFLMEAIQSGRLAVDECLPPETELTEQFGVSRATIRQTISNLVHQGVLTRYKGKGTFVQAPKVQENALQVLEGFHEEMAKKGYVPETRVLDHRMISGIPEINNKLGIPETEALYLLRRTRSVNGEVVLTINTYLPAARFPGLLEKNFEQHSLYELLETCYGYRVNRVVRHIEAASADREEAALLGVERKSAVFHVDFTGYCNDTEPVEYSKTTYRGDRVEFVVEVRR